MTDINSGINLLYQLTKQTVLKYGKNHTIYLNLQTSDADLQIFDRLIKDDNNIVEYRVIAPYQSDTPEEDLLEVEFYKK